MPLMSLGMFAFEVGTAPYQELSRKTDWRHGSSPRFGALPATQYLGPGDDDISLSGALLPGLAGSFGAIDALREMADTGDAWPLVSGEGRVFGNFRIESLTERRSHFLENGAARRGDFTIELKKVS